MELDFGTKPLLKPMLNNNQWESVKVKVSSELFMKSIIKIKLTNKHLRLLKNELGLVWRCIDSGHILTQ